MPISAHELPQAIGRIRVFETNHSQFVNSEGMTQAFEDILDAEEDNIYGIDEFFQSN